MNYYGGGKKGRVIVPGAAQWKAERQMWRDMRKRCLNPKSEWFKDYGARGITVCDRWMEFSNFYRDMGPRPQGMTLERIDNDKGYSPENCRWATQAEQNMNTRRSVKVEIDGETLPVKVWCERLGVKYRSVIERVNRGMTHYEALTTPWRKSPCPRPPAT